MWRLFRQRRSKPAQRDSVGRQAEPQQLMAPVEAATPDLLPGQCGMPFQGVDMSRQPEQRRAADNLETGIGQYVVELDALCDQRDASLRSPALVAQSGRADDLRRSGTGPWTDGSRDTLRDQRRREREAETQTREAVELTKRAQDHHRQCRAQIDSADRGIDIGEGLIDHQPAAAPLQDRRNISELVAHGDTPVGIVGIDDHHMLGVVRQRTEAADHANLMSAGTPSRDMLVIGRPDDGNGARRGEMRQPLDQRLRTGSGNDIDVIGHVVSAARGGQQRLFVSARRQAFPKIARQVGRNGPRPWIDPGREIEPLVRRAAEFRHRLREIATMFHACVMPSYRAKRERLWPLAAATLALLAWAPLQASAAEQPRIASINLCTDQLLVTLADPEQILGLSPYARDPFRSWDKDKATAFRLLSGEAEDVLALKPDVVVAGRFTKRATRELLKDKGLKVTEFDPARSLDDVKKQLRQMGALVKHPERAEAEIAKLDSAIAQAHAAVQRKPLRVLAVSRRGWVSGGENLTTSLLSAVGLRNAGGELGLKAGGFASLEAIVTLRPDLLLVTDSTDFAEDEGRAFLLHPALEKFYPASKRLVLPERLTACGGPTMVEALDRLAAEISRVAP